MSVAEIRRLLWRLVLVIKQTIGQDLPEGFQTAEFLLEHGVVDMVVPRHELKPTVGRLLRHMSGKPAAASGWLST